MKNLIYFQNFSKNVAEVRMEICHQSEAYTLVKLFLGAQQKMRTVLSNFIDDFKKFAAIFYHENKRLKDKLGPYSQNFIFIVTYKQAQQVRVFVTGKYFQPSLMQHSSLLGRFAKWSVVITAPVFLPEKLLQEESRGQNVNS